MRALGSTMVVGCLAFSSIASADEFTLVSSAAGLSSQPKATFGNPIWGDMNNDGYIDLIAPHHGGVPDIYVNDQDGTFTQRPVTTVFGAGYFNEHNDQHGFSFTDFDNDNVLDVFITVGAQQGNPGFTKRDLLYRGLGNAVFELVTTTAGVDNPTGRGRSSCWFDHDADGNLDFWLKNLATPNAFFQNSNSGTFTDIAAGLGLQSYENGAVCSLVDYDNDGRLDLFLNSGSLTDTLLRQLPDGTFADVTAAANIASNPRGHGVAWGDYNNDGNMDLYVARGAPESFTGPMSELTLDNNLYINNGDGTFSDTTVIAGIDGNFNTSAAAWGDVNNDEFLDLIVTNAGEVDGSGNDNFLYINNGNGTFTEAASQWKIDGHAYFESHRYNTATFGDYNNDGFLDLILDGSDIGSRFGKSELYRNDGNSNSYLEIKLIGVRANSLGIGSVVSVTTATSTQIRQHTGATDGVRYSQSQQPMHFGVGLANSTEINVEWPEGARVASYSIQNIAPNQSVTLEEGLNIVRGLAVDRLDKGCYIWRNTFGWSMRCRGEVGTRVQFTGQITSNGAITSVNPLNLEPNDVVTSDTNTINFDLFALQGNDTINFTTTGDTVTFDILQDGIHEPLSVRIGKYAVLPASLPVTLTE